MKKMIVIGATSGIGRALAKLYSRKGYDVGIAGRRTGLLTTLASEIPTKAYLLTTDITDTDAAIQALKKLIHDMQGVDLIIISAGTGYLNDSLDWEKEKETIETNVLGFAAVAGAAMRYFMEQGSGHLVAISSIASIRGSGICPSYNASKAFMANYLEGLRVKVEKKRLPVTITDIQPGLVDTAMAKGDGLFWVSSPEKAAAQMYTAIQKKKKRVYVTKRWAIIALLLKIVPGFIYNKL